MPNLSDFSTACLIWLARVRRETVQPWPCRRPRTAGEPGKLTADCLQAEPGGGRGNRTPATLSGRRISNPLHYRSAIPPENRGPAGDPVPGAALATPRSRMWRFGLSMRGRALPPGPPAGPPSCPSVSPYCCRIPAAFPLLSYCGGGICMPRSTAGRLPTASNQRFTFGKSARSICCHSRRNTQGQVAISAIE